MNSQDIALIAHLMRRAGFGATRDELDTYAVKGYNATVEDLLDFQGAQSMPVDLIRRYHHDHSAMFESTGSGSTLLYRLIRSTCLDRRL